MYSPSNGATTNVVLAFSRSRTVRPSEKCLSMTFIEVESYGVIGDLDLHFEGQTISCYAFAIKNGQAANVPQQIASTPTATTVKLLLRNITSNRFRNNITRYMHVMHVKKAWAFLIVCTSLIIFFFK